MHVTLCIVLSASQCRFLYIILCMVLYANLWVEHEAQQLGVTPIDKCIQHLKKVCVSCVTRKVQLRRYLLSEDFVVAPLEKGVQ